MIAALLPLLVLITSCVVVLPGVRCAFAESFPAGVGVRSEYLRLRNLDPSGDTPLHAARWVSLANEMNNLYLRSGALMPIRDRLFAAETQMRVYRSGRNPLYLNQALVIVDSILAARHGPLPDYPDALVLRGDIGVARGDPVAQITGFYRQASELERGASARAQQRLQSLANGTFSRGLPSEDLEVPRGVANTQRPGRLVTKRIILDPGHGGFDCGASGSNASSSVAAGGGASRGDGLNGRGLLEKDVTLDIAQRLKVLLERDPSIAVHLTRTTDTFVPLARRTAFANKKQGNAFVSLHLNASPSHSVRGLESYYLDTTDDDASRLLAERENGVVHGGEVDDLSFILSDLIQSGKLEESVELSHHLQRAVFSASRKVYREARSNGVKKGPFFVLVGAHMPCTLIELFFIDNAKDGAKLATEPFRSIVSEGLAQGLTQFALGTPVGGERSQDRAQLRPLKGPKKSARRHAKKTKT